MVEHVRRLSQVSPQIVVKLRETAPDARVRELREFLSDPDLPGTCHSLWCGNSNNGYWRMVFSDARTAMMFKLRFC